MYKRQQGALEVIVIDNGSTDDTHLVCKNHQAALASQQKPESSKKNPKSFNTEFNYYFEPQEGLSRARNTAIAHAKGELVFFIDDDAIPNKENWVDTLSRSFINHNTCAAGGDINPNWQSQTQPPWLSNSLLTALGAAPFEKLKHSLSTTIKTLRYPYFPFGANIAFRKKDVIDAGGFTTELGWGAGNDMIAGEESELCLRLFNSGKEIVYVPDASVDHTIFDYKLTSQWLDRRAAAQGRCDAVIEVKHLSCLSFCLSAARSLVKIPLFLFLNLLFSATNSKKNKHLSRYQWISAYNYVIQMTKSG